MINIRNVEVYFVAQNAEAMSVVSVVRLLCGLLVISCQNQTFCQQCFFFGLSENKERILPYTSFSDWLL